MANGHGGRRPGAGRKSNAEKYAAVRASVTDRIADGQLDRVAALEILAEGGYEQIEEVWEPAGLIYVGSGVMAEKAFPHLPPEQLVCIRRKRSFAAPDRAANIYLIDRILGKPGADQGEDDAGGGEASAPTIDELLELWAPSEPPSTSSSDT